MMKTRIVIIIIIIIVITSFSFTGILREKMCETERTISDRPMRYYHGFPYDVDVVYTWVNGSDPWQKRGS